MPRKSPVPDWPEISDKYKVPYYFSKDFQGKPAYSSRIKSILVYLPQLSAGFKMDRAWKIMESIERFINHCVRNQTVLATIGKEKWEIVLIHKQDRILILMKSFSIPD